MNWKWSSRRVALVTAVLAGLVGIAVLAGASLASSSHRATAGSSSIIVDGTTDSVVNIDPANQYDYGSFTVDLPIFEGLYGFPNGAKLQPVLATGCKASANLKTWTCGLHKNVKFWDGNPMTSADVKYSFDRVQKIKGDQGIYTLLSNLASTTAPTPYSVVFHLKTPQSTWPLILSTNAGYVVEKAKYPFDKILSNTDQQYGTGPYKLTKYTPGQQAVFQPNPNYWGAKPKNGGIIINYYSKSSTMKLALEKGEIDMAFRDFTPTELASLKTEKGIVVHSGNGVVIRYLVFNVARAPFNNIAIRQALAYLMPRQDIASRIYHNTVKPLYSMVPAGLPGATTPYKSMYGPTPSVAKAKAVIAKAGLKTPIPITLWYTPTHYGDVSADEYTEMQRAFQASGLFKVTLKSAEWAQYSSTLGKTYGAFQLGWFPDYPDAEDYTVSFYQTGAFFNNGYSSPQMTKLIAQERGSKTTSQRIAVLGKMQALGAKDLPTIPYWQGNMIAVSHSDIQGLDNTLDAAFYMRFWKLSKS